MASKMLRALPGEPADFGDEQRVVGAAVRLANLPEGVGGVDINIGCNQIDVGGGPLPQVQHRGHRPAAGVADARLAPVVFAQPDVHVERQVEDGFTGFRQAVDIAGDAPGAEEFGGVRPKDLLPGAVPAFPRGCPGGQYQAVRGGCQRLEKLGGHFRAKFGFGRGAVIAHRAKNAGFVFNLNPGDHLFLGVNFFEVGEQRAEGAAVCLPIGLAV